jgi:hypothetical protein
VTINLDLRRAVAAHMPYTLYALLSIILTHAAPL